jgi:2-oxoglutarate ferredoxin oxidoreductase subunit gamma
MTEQRCSTDEERILVAGFGGQGVLTLGKLLCVSAISEGKQVTYLPAYGSEVRGGTANCHVVISENEIFSPYVEAPQIAVILNQPSLDRFGDAVRDGGSLLLNSSLAELEDASVSERDVRVVRANATKTAADLGNVLVANVVMLGVLIGRSGICSRQSVEAAIREWFSGEKSDRIEINLDALDRGLSVAEGQCG